MNSEDLRRAVKRGAIDPVYVLHGENAYLHDELIAAIAGALPVAAEDGLNYSVYDAQGHDAAAIVQDARTLPFAAARKLVVVKNAHAFTESLIKPLYTYAARPSRHTCMILVMPVSGKNKKDRTRLENFKKHVSAVPCANPRTGRDAGRFIRQCAQRFGKDIASDAAGFLAEHGGSDARQLAGEVEKAALYCGDKKRIETEDVLAVLCSGETADIFDFVKEVGKGHLEASLLRLNRLLETGTPPPVVLSMVSRQFRLLLKAHEGIARGDSISRIGAALSVRYENLVKDVVSQARGWSAESISAAFDDIFRLHSQLRTSRVSGRLLLEQLVYRLAERRDQLSA